MLVCGHTGNVYGVLPKTKARDTSIILMLMHQLVAFCLYSAPLYYMCACHLSSPLCHEPSLSVFWYFG